MRSSLVSILFAVLAWVWLAPSVAKANVRLPSLISDNIVLQADAKDAVWGLADPDERVTVTLGSVSATTSADGAGRWKVEIGPLHAGGPFTMTIAGKNTIVVHNVLIGQGLGLLRAIEHDL